MKLNKNDILKWILNSAMIVVVAGIIFQACKKDTAPHNPFSDIDYGKISSSDTIDPRSFVGIHKQIFATKCAMPGCHDGNFEPDFRTVQSSYTTLVYHPVVKKLNPWVFRVMPYDTAKSWLWQRLNHSLIISGADTSSGQMPLYSKPLSKTQLDNIAYWIMNGARDMFGQIPNLPNNEPSILYYAAFNPGFTVEYDTIRVGGLYYNPFKVPASTAMNVFVVANDDSTLIQNLTNNKLKLSKKIDDFTSASVYNGVYFSFGAYKAWEFSINTGSFSSGDTLFMRYYTNDGDHTADTEFPRNDILYGYKSYWSFIVQ